MEQRRKQPVLHKQARELIYKVNAYFKKEASAVEDNGGPACSVVKCAKQTAEACGVGVRSVQRIVNEGKLSGNAAGIPVFSSPGKKRQKEKPITGLDEFDLCVLRRKVLEFYDRGEFPTAKKLVCEMKESIGFIGSETSMLRILRSLGFKYRKCNDGRKFLMERSDIAAARIVFLRKMHEIRESGNIRIFYTDETWLNQNHTRKQCWQNSDGSGGLKVPTGKGGRIIICHAGSAETGFIPQSKLVFRSKTKSDTDYHGEMNAECFKTWFTKQFLPYLPSHSVIVMDNAPYHSVIKNKAPTSNTKKSEIIAWLVGNKVPYCEKQTRVELLQLVKLHKPQTKQYELDGIAESQGHTVVRLPPYHCQYNAIELIWAQVKGYVAEHNRTFKLSDIEKLFEEALRRIDRTSWENCVRHTEKLQEEDYQKELARDNVMEPLIINLADDSDTDSSASSDEDEIIL